MESKNISIVAIVLLVFVGFFVWGYSGKQENDLKSSLVAPEVFYDFGTISMKNGNVTKEFTVVNPTNSDIEVSTVLTSCMCTTAFVVSSDGSIKGPFRMPGMGYVPPANEIIKAGESRIIRVVYDPNAHGPAGVGQINRFVTLTDTSGGVVQLEIKALVTP